MTHTNVSTTDPRNPSTSIVPILIVNTANGFAKKTDNALLNVINDEKALVTVVSESNAQTDKDIIMNTRKRLFKDFIIEDKTWPGYNLARVSVIISKKLKYIRRADLENNFNATIVIEIIISKNNKLFVIGNYRQWQGKSPLCPYNEYDFDHQKWRFTQMVDLWQNVLKLGKCVFC